jgi:hypothetical protein
VALNSFDRRFEPEQCDVRIHDWDKAQRRYREFARSFMASFESLNQGVRVTFDERGRGLIEKAARRRNEKASEDHLRLLPGWDRDGNVHGCAGELALVALAGIPNWYVVPHDLTKDSKSTAPDVGRQLQVRTTQRHTSEFLILRTRDGSSFDDVPIIQASAEPPLVIIRGWMYGAEIKRLGRLTDFGHPEKGTCLAADPKHFHDLCDLPEDNYAWLRSLPTGYLKQIQKQEQYEKEHVGEFQF